MGCSNMVEQSRFKHGELKHDRFKHGEFKHGRFKQFRPQPEVGQSEQDVEEGTLQQQNILQQ